jgi:hypothetical protein
VQRKCRNFPTATTPDDGQQAETCSVKQSVMQHATILMKLKHVLKGEVLFHDRILKL